MKQKKLIFNFFVNRNCKKLTDSRKRAKILADNRKSHHPIETLNIYCHSGEKWGPAPFYQLIPNLDLKQLTDHYGLGRVVEKINTKCKGNKNKVVNYICPIFRLVLQTFNGSYKRKMNTDKR